MLRKLLSMGLMVLILVSSVNVTIFANQTCDEPSSITVENWNVTEITLHSSQNYDNPFLDVEVIGTFVGPKGETVVRQGFWNGDSEWKIRFAPIGVGKWKYSITSNQPSDPALNNISGVIESVPYTGDLEIYKKGFLKCSDDNRYLTYADGSPFFWLGDTHWFFENKEKWDSSNKEGTDSQFKYMVDKRVEQEFTVYQSVIFGAHDSYWKEGEYGTQINAEYFRDYIDRKMEYIAQAGLVNAFGVGFSSNVDNFVEGEVNLAKYIVARYGAYPMAYLTAGEGAGGTSGYEKEVRLKNWADVGKEINRWDYYNHPQTAHYTALSIREQTGMPQYYIGEGWLDFIMLQGGHKYVAPEKEYQFYYDNFELPFLEAEANYELINDGWATDEIVRRTAYRSIQAGGFGFTYGANGIWNAIWDDNDTADESGYGHENWYDAIELPGAAQMTLLKHFYESIPWETLVPIKSSDAVWNAGLEEYEKPVIKADENYNYITVCYPPQTPYSGEISNVPGAAYTVKWFNPRTGNYTLAEDITSTENKLQIPAMPDDNDWIILLERKEKHTGTQENVSPSTLLPYREVTQSDKSVIIYDIKNTCELSKLQLVFNSNNGWKYKIESSNDQQNWTVMIDHSRAGIKSGQITENLSGSARYIKITFTDSEKSAVAACSIYGKVNKAALLQSSYYVVDVFNFIINGVPDGINYTDFMSKLTPSLNGKIEVFESDNVTPVTSGNITEDMVVKITASDGEASNSFIVKTIENLGVNLAYRKNVTVSSVENPYYSANGITDGNNDTINFHGWSVDILPGWAEIDFNEQTTFNKIKLYTKKDYELSAYTVKYLDSNGEWVNCFDSVTGNSQAIWTHFFDSVTSSKLRVEVNAGSVAQMGIARIQELEVYNLTGILVENIRVNGENGSDNIDVAGSSLQMTADVLPADANNSAVSWKVANAADDSPTKSATISKKGLLTAVSNGRVKVTAKAKDGSEIMGEKIITITNQDESNVSVLVSQGKSCSVSTELTGANASCAFDGIETNNWIADGASFPQWLCVDLGEEYDLVQVEQIFAEQDEYKYIVEGSVTGNHGEWEVLVDKSAYNGVSEKTFCYDVYGKARYVRLTILGARQQWASSKEFSVYARPKPKPEPISQGKPATASSYHDAAVAQRAVDGDMETDWICRYSEQLFPQWLLIDLEGLYDIVEINQIFCVEDQWKYIIEGSTDGQTWSTMADNSMNTGYITDITHTVNQRARYVRLTITGAKESWPNWPNSREFIIYGKPV